MLIISFLTGSSRIDSVPLLIARENSFVSNGMINPVNKELNSSSEISPASGPASTACMLSTKICGDFSHNSSHYSLCNFNSFVSFII